MTNVNQKRKIPSRKTPSANSVFINCPFDADYRPLFYAVVFTAIDCGFSARCALEIDDGSEVRIEKIVRIIGECRYGIHDLSRTELDAIHGLPRFNMPLELGLFLGAKRFGGGDHPRKNCLILDIEPYRYQKFISDLAGQDIRAHDGKIPKVISAIRDWLQAASRHKDLPGGADINRRFTKFQSDIPGLCDQLRLQQHEMTFVDFYSIAATWLDERASEPTINN